MISPYQYRSLNFNNLSKDHAFDILSKDGFFGRTFSTGPEVTLSINSKRTEVNIETPLCHATFGKGSKNIYMKDDDGLMVLREDAFRIVRDVFGNWNYPQKKEIELAYVLYPLEMSAIESVCKAVSDMWEIYNERNK